jgi:predicted AAA+ superfamily ATPase
MKKTGENKPSADNAFIYRWSANDGAIAIHWQSDLRINDLLYLEHQAKQLITNTRQFIHGYPANNVLLWGARGTGKSSLLQAVFSEYIGNELNILELSRNEFHDWPKMICWLNEQAPGKFIIFCDDISFNKDDADYAYIKAALEGSLTSLPSNALLYATSNRRHLLPEQLADNQFTRHVEGEIHHNEAVEEAISLSDRFGLWLSFHALTQDQYLDIVSHWMNRFGLTEEESKYREQALRWALQRGSRSGRIANQFARDYAGKKMLDALNSQAEDKS